MSVLVISINEKKALKALANKENTFITKADMGSAIVIVDADDYVNEANRQLPIVNCHTSNISQYIGHKLQPHAKELISYVKDSSDFIRKIDGISIVHGRCILVIIDTRSFYTSIPNNERLKAIKTKRTTSPLQLVILNNFVLNCQCYL